MEQIVIHEGYLIYESIIESLNKAKKDIIVVSAWFTDEDLLNKLVEKAKEGLNVQVVLAVNKDNEKLDFSKLSKAGGKIHWKEKSGYGMLHDKFSVIDREVAFHGSYNWTKNARKNNTESVIKTDHKETVKNLLNKFTMLTEEKITNNSKDGNSNFLKRLFGSKIKTQDSNDKKELNNDNNSEKHTTKDAYDKAFESIISAEIKKTNRDEILKRAYEQAKEVNGDSHVINKSMDSLYHLFISDKNDNEETKRSLLIKIDDKVDEISKGILKQRDANIHQSEIDNHTEEKSLQMEKAKYSSDKGKVDFEISEIENNHIPEIEAKIEEEKNIIAEQEIEFVKPHFKWHEFIPLVTIFLGLAVAMFLFYSSSAYIMLYSFDDAMILKEAGLNANPQIFESNAIRKSLDRDGLAGLYVIFFVFIPFALAYIAHNKGNQNFVQLSTPKKILYKVKSYLPYIAIIGMDVFIAMKVSDTINRINYLSDGIVNNEPFYHDANFWLVFFLGAIPFIFFADLFNRVINIFAERNEQFGKEKAQYIIDSAKNKIKAFKVQIDDKKDLLNDLRIKSNEFQTRINETDHKLIFLPKELNQNIKQHNSVCDNEILVLKAKADVYKNNIENDNIQISLTSLKDRVAAFIEGWKEWLYDEFSVAKAEYKSKEAEDEADNWLSENLIKLEKYETV